MIFISAFEFLQILKLFANKKEMIVSSEKSEIMFPTDPTTILRVLSLKFGASFNCVLETFFPLDMKEEFQEEFLEELE